MGIIGIYTVGYSNSYVQVLPRSEVKILHLPNASDHCLQAHRDCTREHMAEGKTHQFYPYVPQTIPVFFLE